MGISVQPSLSIYFSDPLWMPSRRDYVYTLENSVSSYSHTISAGYGYESASISFSAFKEEIDEWLEFGLGRHVRVVNSDLAPVWEGVVNEVAITYGPLSVTRGPLIEICNRVYVKYESSSLGQGVYTSAANDTDSQAKYGILSRVWATGKLSAANANILRDTILTEYSYPQLTQSVGGSSDASITVTCIGYSKYLDLFPYNKAGTTWTLREKLMDVLVSEPNALFSTDYTHIEPNTLTVVKLENENRTGITIVKELTGLGGPSDNNRRIFGIYEDRKAYYFTVPTTSDYVYRITSSDVQIENDRGGIVQPWDIRPGKWIYFSNFLVGKTVATTLRRDPRLMLIEAVNFTAPADVQLSGGKNDTLSQRLGKLGLSGV